MIRKAISYQSGVSIHEDDNPLSEADRTEVQKERNVTKQG